MSKELEALKDVYDVLSVYGGLNKEYMYEKLTLISNALKAWEIVDKKDVDVVLVKRYANASQYNCAKGRCNKYLDQEEFDLIKGVLKYATL